MTWLLTGRQLAFWVGALGTVMAMIGIPYVMQSFRYRMYEMEKAAKNGFSKDAFKQDGCIVSRRSGYCPVVHDHDQQ